MKKNFVKVSVICALALSGSTFFVGCADYDDDIKNLQEQIDGVTSKLDVSKEELTAAINSSVEALKASVDKQVADLTALNSENAADIETLRTEIANKTADLLASIEGKADATTVESKFKGLKDAVDAFDENLNSTKTDLQGQVDGLKGEQEGLKKQLEELSGKLENSASEEELNALKKDIEEVKKDLQEKTSSLNDALSRLTAIENGNFGSRIATLENKIIELSDLKTKLETYTDEAFANLDAKLTGDIKSGLDGVLEQLKADSTDLAVEINSVDKKLDDYISNQNEIFTNLVERVGALERYKNDVLQAALDGKADKSELTRAVGRIATLEGTVADLAEKFEAGGDFALLKEQVNGLGTQIDELSTELKAMIKTMIQSIVYVPQYDAASGALKNVGFTTLQVKDQISSTQFEFKPIVVNTKQQIKFRVSPAISAEEFEKNYDITFCGEKVYTRASQAAIIKSSKLVKAEDGILTFEIECGEEMSGTSVYNIWSLVAQVTAKEQADENAVENLTNISSDYFAVENSVTRYNALTVTTTNEGSRTVPFDNKEVIDYGAGLKYQGAKIGGGVEDIDLAQFPGFLDKVSVAFSTTGNSRYFEFNEGKINLQESANQNAIGQTATINATISITGFTQQFTKNLGTVTVGMAAPEYTVANEIKAQWSTVNKVLYTLTSEEIADILERTDLRPADFWANVATGTTTTGNGIKFVVDDVNQTIKIEQDANTVVSSDFVAEFEFATNTTGITFTIKAQIKNNAADSNFPTINFTKDPQAWNGNVVGLLKELNASGKYQLVRDIPTIFTDWTTKVGQITANGGRVTATVVNSVPGVSIDAANKLVIDPATYNGDPVSVKIEISYGGYVVNSLTTTADINVTNLGGNWSINTNPASLATTRTIDNTTRSVDLAQGFKWTVDGQTIWENGVETAEFAKYPFELPGGVDNPSFEYISGESQYLELVGSTLRLRDTGTENNFQTDHVVKLRVKVNPLWCTVAGYSDATSVITVTIKAGTTTH